MENVSLAAALNEEVKKRWQPIIESEDLEPIKDNWRRQCTTILLENQRNALNESRTLLEDVPTSNIGRGNIGTYDPILIGMVRRAAPQLIAYDVCGVQPMTGPTGLIFAMRARYGSQTGDEALFDEANTAFSGMYQGGAFGSPLSSDPGNANFAANVAADSTAFGTGNGMSTLVGESLGYGDSNHFQEMSFSIDKVTAEAVTRALKSEYTTELEQDLRAIHGLDAQAELSNILSDEIVAEVNREVLRKIFLNSKMGCQKTTTAGIFDFTNDADGRWLVENFKGLMFQIERESNTINREVRRGRGNLLVASPDVISALNLAGALDYDTNLNVDTSTSTFAGTINGRIKVFIDPYYNSEANGGLEFAMVGYRGVHPFDAGFFYCPYVPLQMFTTIGENTMQPKIAYKTRYATVVNPFVNSTGAIGANENQYYRRFGISGLGFA